jgi:hypothetical protein
MNYDVIHRCSSLNHDQAVTVLDMTLDDIRAHHQTIFQFQDNGV